jgi:hypothetical protein
VKCGNIGDEKRVFAHDAIIGRRNGRSSGQAGISVACSSLQEAKPERRTSTIFCIAQRRFTMRALTLSTAYLNILLV